MLRESGLPLSATADAPERGDDARRFDPRDPAFLADPYPTFARLQAEEPVARSPLGWFVSSYDDAAEVLSDPRLGHPDYGAGKLLNWWLGPVGRLRRNILITKNPPDHGRLRKPLVPFFAPKASERMAPTIRRWVDDLLDRRIGTGAMDVVADFARPLPFTIACEVIGIPVGDRPALDRVVRKLSAIFDVVPQVKLRQAKRTVGELFRYFDDLVRRKLADPADDVVSVLAASQQEGGPFDRDELLANLILVLEGAQVTSVQLIGNAVLALLEHPDQLDLLRREPDRIHDAVEEFLRFGSPIRMIGRMTLEDVTLGDVRIAKGQTVYALVGAANRDPKAFDEPHRLDITRRPNRHLGFGHGAHYCLGAPLARATAAAAIGALVRRMPELALVAGPREREPLLFLNALKRLPVTF